jgi:hypothetical protein
MPGQPVVVHKLHYEFEGWLGDSLIESTPCYIVSEGMAQKLREAGLSGFALDDVEVTKSETFGEMCGGRELPKFRWLKVGGVPGQDDFGVTPNLVLVVSRRALEVLKAEGIAHALVGPFAG